MASEPPQRGGLQAAVIFVILVLRQLGLGAGYKTYVACAVLQARQERGKGQRVIWDSGKRASHFFYQRQAAALKHVVNSDTVPQEGFGCCSPKGRAVSRMASVTFARRRLQNEGVLLLEEVQLPGHVAGGERIVSCYHHYLRGEREGSKISSG